MPVHIAINTYRIPFCSPLYLKCLVYLWLDTFYSIMSMIIPPSLSFQHWTPPTLWTVYLQMWYITSQCQLWVMLDQARTIHQSSLVRLMVLALVIWVYSSTLLITAVPSLVCTVTTTESTGKRSQPWWLVPHKASSHKVPIVSPISADSSLDSSISVIISVLMSVAVSCVVFFGTTCFCYHVIIRRRRTLKEKDQVSKQVATVFQTKEKSPEYEEICLQNHPQFHIVKNIAYASNDWHWVMLCSYSIVHMYRGL